MIVALVLAIAVVLAAGGYAWKMVSADPGFPPLANPPVLKIGAPPKPIPMPTEEEITAGLAALKNAVPSPYFLF